ncbi:MAG: hypothetical protein ACYDBP_07220 [Leptospirales bacterium]
MFDLKVLGAGKVISVCDKCDAEENENLSSCPKCGASYGVECDECGELFNPETDDYCPVCG